MSNFSKAQRAYIAQCVKSARKVAEDLRSSYNEGQREYRCYLLGCLQQLFADLCGVTSDELFGDEV